MNNPPDGFKVAGIECTFSRSSNEACPIRYKAQGICSLYSVSQQLFSDINLEISTNKFIVPTKFNVGRVEVFVCPGNPRNGIVSFVAKSTESVELVPQQLSLGADTRLRLSWETLIKFNPERLEVKLRGSTSIGIITIINEIFIYGVHFSITYITINKHLDETNDCKLINKIENGFLNAKVIPYIL